MEEKRSNKWWLVLLLIFLALFIFVLLWWRFGKADRVVTNNSVPNDYVKCKASSSDTPTPVAGWVSNLYSAPLKDESSNRGTSDSGAKEFSIKEMEGKIGNSVYHRLERTGFEQKEYVTGAKVVLEVCDENNETSKFYSTTNDKIKPAGEKISATIMHLHNNPKVFHPGNYRVDVFVNIDGNWVMINRMDGVRLVK